jgi:hypothetical protein
MENSDYKSIDQADEILKQKLNNIIKDSRTKSSALKKIIKGLEDQKDKHQNSKPDK